MTLIVDRQRLDAPQVERVFCRNCGVVWEQMRNIPDPRGLRDRLPNRQDCPRCGSHLTQRLAGVLII